MYREATQEELEEAMKTVRYHGLWVRVRKLARKYFDGEVTHVKLFTFKSPDTNRWHIDAVWAYNNIERVPVKQPEDHDAYCAFLGLDVDYLKGDVMLDLTDEPVCMEPLLFVEDSDGT